MVEPKTEPNIATPSPSTPVALPVKYVKKSHTYLLGQTAVALTD